MVIAPNTAKKLTKEQLETAADIEAVIDRVLKDEWDGTGVVSATFEELLEMPSLKVQREVARRYFAVGWKDPDFKYSGTHIVYTMHD